jgi:hypothetical protein
MDIFLCMNNDETIERLNITYLYPFYHLACIHALIVMTSIQYYGDIGYLRMESRKKEKKENSSI